MREKKYHIYLNDQEYIRAIHSLIALKNDLSRQGRYTDAVDDLLLKMSKAKKVILKVQYN